MFSIRKLYRPGHVVPMLVASMISILSTLPALAVQYPYPVQPTLLPNLVPGRVLSDGRSVSIEVKNTGAARAAAGSKVRITMSTKAGLITREVTVPEIPPLGRVWVSTNTGCMVSHTCGSPSCPYRFVPYACGVGGGGVLDFRYILTVDLDDRILETTNQDNTFHSLCV